MEVDVLDRGLADRLDRRLRQGLPVRVGNQVSQDFLVDFGLEPSPDDLGRNAAAAETGELELLTPLPERRLDPVGHPLGGQLDVEDSLGRTEFFNCDFHGFSRGVNKE